MGKMGKFRGTEREIEQMRMDQGTQGEEGRKM